MPEDPPIVQRKREAIGRALVVDDDRGMQRLLSRVLGMGGLEVDQASDGEEGLRRAMAACYQVVLLDLQLPKLNGMTVLRHLLSTRPGQAVIVSSCQSDLGTSLRSAADRAPGTHRGLKMQVRGLQAVPRAGEA